MSARWQKRRFQVLIPPTQTLILITIMDGNTCVANQESSEKILAPHWSKISINRCIEEGKKNSFTLLMSPLPKGSVTQCQERSSQPVIFPRGKVKVEWAPCFPSLVRHCPRSQLLFQPTQVTEVISIAKYFGGYGEKKREWAFTEATMWISKTSYRSY